MRTFHAIAVVSLWAATAQLLAQAAPKPASAAPQAATASPIAASASAAKPYAEDWAQLSRYAAADAALPPPTPGTPRVVFFGDSITDVWNLEKFFPGKHYINRGISGQTTTQMLVRFEQDVIALHPAVVVILAGTNDIATYPSEQSPHIIENNLQAMHYLAKESGIRVVFASITPVRAYPWNKDLVPGPIIHDVNNWTRDFCNYAHLTYLDYFPSLVDDNDGMRKNLTLDGIHMTEAGYTLMGPLAEAAIQEALKR